MGRFGGALTRTVWRRLALALGVVVVLGLAGAAAANVWAQSHYDRAARALRAYHLDEARTHVRRCLQVWRRSPAAHLLAARIERARGDYEQAEAYLNDYQRLKPRVDEDWQLEMVLLRAQRGELDEVEKGLWACVRQDHPDTLPMLEALSRAYLRHMRFLPALVALNEWLKREPDTVRALDWRGWVYQRMLNSAGAARDYQRALELEPERTDVRVRLADILLDDGDPVKAQPHVERLLREHPDQPDVQRMAARYHLLRGNLDEARRLLDLALVAQPDNAVALCSRGQVELEANRPAEAEPWLRKALKIEPSFLDAHTALHTCLRQQGNREAEADAQLKRSEELRAKTLRLSRLLSAGKVDLESNDPRPASEIGDLLLQTDQESFGLYWLEQVALGRDRNHIPTHEILASYYEKTKRPKLAARHRKAIEEARKARPSPAPY